jgi:hypothetical protein
MKWIAFYVKFVPEAFSPLDQEQLHGFPCEGESPTEAIENLEKEFSTPYRVFLTHIAPEGEAKSWLEKTEAEARQIGAKFNYKLHGGK